MCNFLESYFEPIILRLYHEPLSGIIFTCDFLLAMFRQRIFIDD